MRVSLNRTLVAPLIPAVSVLLILALGVLTLAACDSGPTPLSPSSPLPPASSSSLPLETYTLSGNVRESTNPQAVPDVRIEVTDGPNAGRFTTTDREGRFALPLLEGRFQLRVSRSGDVRRDFTMQRITYGLVGIVRESPSGTPLADADVEILSGPYAGQRATTHKDGSYGLSVRETVRVRAAKPGWESQEATVTVTGPASTYQDFLLPRRPSDSSFSIQTHARR